MKNSGLFPEFAGWGKEYCSLTYSNKEKPILINYVKNQQEHHRKISFREEVYAVFTEMGVDLDERFFLD